MQQQQHYPQYEAEPRVNLAEDKRYAEELLKEAFAQNRLDLDEFERRTEIMVRAETRAELESIVRDLTPTRSSSVHPTPVHRSPAHYASSGFPHITVMGDRTTNLELDSSHHTFVTVMGSNKVYVKGSALSSGRIKLSEVTIMGDLVIHVPRGIAVRVNIVPIMADVKVDPSIPQNLSGALEELVIDGVVIMGDVRVVNY